MTTEYKLNTLIEWTDEDRAKGKCPVPAGSDVTLQFVDGEVCRGCSPNEWDWGETVTIITAYIIHSVPRETKTSDNLKDRSVDMAALEKAILALEEYSSIPIWGKKLAQDTIAELKGDTND